MKFSAVVLGFCAALVAASPVPEAAPTLPNPKDIKIIDVKYAGSGCPAGSVAVSEAADWQTVTLAFDQYVASISPGNNDPTKSRKNCNINVNLYYPDGWQYTLFQTDYSGFAQLDKNVRATQQSDYWFAGFVNQKATLRSTWLGPFTDTYTFTDIITNDKYVWSPCKKVTTLNINTQLWLDNSQNPHGSGLITTDVIDHTVKTKHHIQWRQC